MEYFSYGSVVRTKIVIRQANTDRLVNEEHVRVGVP